MDTGHGGDVLLDARSTVLAEIWMKPGVLGPMMNGAKQNQGSFGAQPPPPFPPFRVLLCH